MGLGQIGSPEFKIAPEKYAGGLGIAVAGRKAREVDLHKTLITQDLAGLQTLVAVVENDHPTLVKMFDGGGGALPAEGAVVVDDDDVVMGAGMVLQSCDFGLHFKWGLEKFHRGRKQVSKIRNPLHIRFDGRDLPAASRPPKSRKAAAPLKNRSFREIKLR